MRNFIPIILAIVAIALLGYVHYESCITPKTAKHVFFLSQTRTCQLPGLIYEYIKADLSQKEQ